MQCWGANDLDQLGSSVVTEPFVSPDLPAGIPVVRVAAGRDFTLARLNDGRVFCWGSNANGVCGPNGGATSNLPVEVPVATTSGIDQVAAGGSFACAAEPFSIESDQRVYCWGANDRGQLGRGTSGPGTPTPATVTQIGGETLEIGEFLGLSLGEAQAFALGYLHDVEGWGDDADDLIPSEDPPDAREVHAEAVQLRLDITEGIDVSFASGAGRPLQRGHACAVNGSFRRIDCWGANGFGQLGTGTLDDEVWPRSVDFSAFTPAPD